MSTMSNFAKYRRVRKMSESFDGVDVRHPGFSVLDVYDNPHIISLFLVDFN